MITVQEAAAIIAEHAFTPQAVEVRFEDSIGKVLAEPVLADRDLPAFHRVSMDGIAFCYEAWKKGRREFHVEGTQAAGEPQKKLVDVEACLEVMTGAVLPEGCDTVVRYEDLDLAGGSAKVTTEAIIPWQSVHLQGADARRGDTLLSRGQVIAPSEVALLAAVGKASVRVFEFPRVAIVSTGDELVAVGETPKPYQIRRSNSYALRAAVRASGGDAVVYHLSDEQQVLDDGVHRIADDHDVVILSGGVSRGKFDFVPGALEKAGIRKLFHQVSQRPGKPFWFGASAGGKVAFALPGNPVSTFLCFYRYVRPWLQLCQGATPRREVAILGADYSFAPPLTCFLQVAVSIDDQGRALAMPVPGGGSGDFANLKKVTGFLELPLGKSEFKAGEVYPYIGFRQ